MSGCSVNFLHKLFQNNNGVELCDKRLSSKISLHCILIVQNISAYGYKFVNIFGSKKSCPCGSSQKSSVIAPAKKARSWLQLKMLEHGSSQKSSAMAPAKKVRPWLQPKKLSHGSKQKKTRPLLHVKKAQSWLQPKKLSLDSSLKTSALGSGPLVFTVH